MLPEEPLISTITLAEHSIGPLAAASEEERAAGQAHVQQAEADFGPLPFDAHAAGQRPQRRAIWSPEHDRRRAEGRTSAVAQEHRDGGWNGLDA